MLQRIRVGKRSGIAFELSCFQIDEFTWHPFLLRDPDRSNDTLAGIDRNVTECTLGFIILRVFFLAPFTDLKRLRFFLCDERHIRQKGNRPFNIFLKRSRQRDRQTVERLREHDAPNFNGKITAAVNDRQAGDSIAELQDVHDGSSLLKMCVAICRLRSEAKSFIPRRRHPRHHHSLDAAGHRDRRRNHRVPSASYSPPATADAVWPFHSDQWLLRPSS